MAKLFGDLDKNFTEVLEMTRTILFGAKTEYFELCFCRIRQLLIFSGFYVSLIAISAWYISASLFSEIPYLYSIFGPIVVTLALYVIACQEVTSLILFRKSDFDFSLRNAVLSGLPSMLLGALVALLLVIISQAKFIVYRQSFINQPLAEFISLSFDILKYSFLVVLLYLVVKLTERYQFALGQRYLSKNKFLFHFTSIFVSILLLIVAAPFLIFAIAPLTQDYQAVIDFAQTLL